MMKLMKWVARAVVVMLLGAACNAFAFDVAMPAEAAMEDLKKTDCLVDAPACHYYSAVETAAYFDACPDALSQKFKENKYTAEQLSEIQSWLMHWSALSNEAIKTAVLSPDNQLRKFLAKDTLKYLLGISVEELSIECSRLGFTKEGAEPEDMSDLLRMSKNFPAWEAARAKAKQDKEEDAKFKDILEQVQKKLD